MVVNIFVSKDNKCNRKLNIRLTGCDLESANNFRKLLINDVTGIALDDFIFHENSTVSHSNFLMNRIELIPVIVPSDIYASTPSTRVELDTLRYTFECPKKTSNRIDDVVYVIMSEHIQLPEPYKLLPGIVITKIKQGQTLDFSAKIVSDSPIKHTKYMTIGFPEFKYGPSDPSKFDDNPDEFVIGIENIGGINTGMILKKAIQLMKEKGHWDKIKLSVK